MNYRAGYWADAAQAQRDADFVHIRARFWYEHGSVPTALELQQISCEWYAKAREWYENGREIT